MYSPESMNSNISSPSPPSSSSLNAPSLADAPEVRSDDGEAETSEPSTSVTAVPMEIVSQASTSAPVNQLLASGIDMSSVIKNNAVLQALLASASAGGFGDNAGLTMSKLLTAALANGSTAVAKRDAGSPRTDIPKKTRLKVFSNGFFMTFDKLSSCQKKYFWRCEYKNTCKARMHTDIVTEKILTFIHEHNHSAPIDEEVRLYGLDPTNIERNRVYIVGNVADPNQRRKIRKQVADREAAAKRLVQQQEEEQQKQQSASSIVAARAAYAQAMQNGSIPTSSGVASFLQSTSATAPMTSHSMLLAQMPFLNNIKTEMSNMVKNEQFTPERYTQHMSPNLTATIAPLIIPTENYDSPSYRQPAIKRKATDLTNEEHDLRRDPMFQPTFELARKLRKLWKGEPNRYPRTTTTPTHHFEFFLSKNDGTDEHLYVPMRINLRDEAHLKEALQDFCGQQCIGMLLFGISPKISVMFNQPMLNNWDNNQFFLLDISNPSRWRLMYVDDQAV
ncbi:FLYWCH transcription factor 1 [Caenorhabditis elegans]|uniref:Isoform b of FLYWCH transcription factor 1 n=1 Tax=Caenorhabditis elegans TaxID=6239 RepID=Q9XWR1-2|nr:FLYWCH transcription factor 1 [Caenorhabditis elegans]CAO82067.1 FLYWCH transcription factor 1 [Caenorhabditis elegans]|eukprot:NP_001122806.1 FLYWCH zinc finger transcription factor homolog [Caenorhabditis elegans]